MRCLRMSGAKRIAAGILGLLLLAVVLFSAFYPAAEADHDCAGEDCAVCICIRLCENTFRRFGSVVPVLFTAAVPLLLFFAAAAPLANAILLKTPVSGKDRLNN